LTIHTHAPLLLQLVVILGAARLCGLHYGSDVRILDNLREI